MIQLTHDKTQQPQTNNVFLKDTQPIVDYFTADILAWAVSDCQEVTQSVMTYIKKQQPLFMAKQIIYF